MFWPFLIFSFLEHFKVFLGTNISSICESESFAVEAKSQFSRFEYVIFMLSRSCTLRPPFSKSSSYHSIFDRAYQSEQPALSPPH